MVKTDYLIIGAGPAGMQTAYFLAEKGKDYLVLEKANRVGKAFEQYPRHKTLISINKPYTGCDNMETNLRWDWNSLLHDEKQKPFTSYTAEYFPSSEVLLDYLADFQETYKLNIQYNTNIEIVKKEKGIFYLKDSNGNEYQTQNLIVATGFGSTYRANFKGLEHAKDYSDVSINQEDFINKRVMIVGKGNSAFETADHLVAHAAVLHLISPSSLKLAWHTHYVGHLRAVNNNILDTYQLKSQNTVIDGEILNVMPRKNGSLDVHIKYSHAMGQEAVINVDELITCTGFRFKSEIFDEATCPIDRSDCTKFPRMNSHWESTSTPGLYFSGVLMHQRDYKKTFSGFIHGFRYNIRALVNMLMEKETSKFPTTELKLKNEKLIENIVERITTDSALFLQPGFLGDTYLIGDNKASLIESLPLDYLHEKFMNQEYLTVNLEYGESVKTATDPFNMERDPNVGESSPYLHPVIRYYKNNELQDLHHIPDDLENEWGKEEYLVGVREFFKRIDLANEMAGEKMTNKITSKTSMSI